MVKNQLRRFAFLEIKSSFTRFLSLLIMSMLGVFVFVGLKATAPFMLNSLDHYLDSNNIYDLKLTSSLGFTNSSLDIIKKIAGVNEVELANSTDIMFNGKNNKEYTIRLHSNQSSINKTMLDIKENEIYVEANLLKITKYQIGDTISLSSSELKYQSFVIKGVVDSALYFNNSSVNISHGKTNIGSGTLNFYAFVAPEAFALDYNKYLYITVKDAIKERTNSKKYLSLVKTIEANINKEALLLDRINKLMPEANQASELIQKYEQGLNDTALALQILNMTKEAFYIYFEELPDGKKTNDLSTLYNGLKSLDKEKDNYLKAKALTLRIDEFLEGQNLIVSSRLNDQTYKSYIDDCNSISNLSLLFPIVFYLVAVLVSLVSMNRMVNDDRLMIGTLKSLGFSNYHIVFKYLIFALMATIIGGLLGASLGLFIIPTLINSIYKILFSVPRFYYGLNLGPTLIGFLISALCICGATIFTLAKSLREKPASLLRPKAIKAGKKILLEKVSFIWRKLKFSTKVTIRNIFRYKKRVIITIIAISGCTALLLCGFGIKDAISDLANKQYLDIISSDATVIFNNVDETIASSALERSEVINKSFASLNAGKVKDYDVNLTFLDDNYASFIHLRDYKTKMDLDLANNKAIISDKLASLIKVKVGDTISFLDDNLKQYELEIGGICEYYIGHVIYLSRNALSADFKVNIAYLALNENLEREEFQKELLVNDAILNISFVSDTINSANDMLKSLDKVVVILIILSAMLSFVVLYNLSNINILERKREIATLKVLGFYPKEVNHYITNENLILTIIGILFGLVLGFFLTRAVVGTVEIEYVRFIQKIKPFSYIISIMLAIFFTIVVNFITHFSLKKIDMIESLKSVE